MIALTFLVALQVGQWTTIPPLNVPRQEVGVAAVEGRVYVIGGIGTDQQGSKVVEIFDTQAGRWRLGPSFPIPIHHPNVAALGSKIYVAGGYSDPGFTPVAKVFELDTDTELWTRKADLRRARAAGAAVEYAGRKNAVALLNTTNQAATLTIALLNSRGEEVTRVSRQLQATNNSRASLTSFIRTFATANFPERSRCDQPFSSPSSLFKSIARESQRSRSRRLTSFQLLNAARTASSTR